MQKRYQVAGLQRSMRYGRRVPLAATASLLHCMQDIWAQEGLKGLYKVRGLHHAIVAALVGQPTESIK